MIVYFKFFLTEISVYFLVLQKILKSSGAAGSSTRISITVLLEN